MCLKVFPLSKGDAQGARKAAVVQASPMLDWEGQVGKHDGHVEGPLSVGLVVVADGEQSACVQLADRWLGELHPVKVAVQVATMVKQRVPQR